MKTASTLEKQPTDPTEPLSASVTITNDSEAGVEEVPVSFLQQQIVCDGRLVSLILLLFCFISGLLGATCFLATGSWCGFQSANTAQLGIALAETFSPSPGAIRPGKFRTIDQQALCSLVSFVVGTQTPRVLSLFHIRPRSRAFFCIATILQALTTGAGALTNYLGDHQAFAMNQSSPSWQGVTGFATIACLAGSLGAQGVLGEHAATPFTSTVVATSLFCQLGMLPRQTMLKLGFSRPRDVKVSALLALMFGAFCGRALVGSVGSEVAIGVAALVKLVAGILWLFCPGQPPLNAGNR